MAKDKSFSASKPASESSPAATPVAKPAPAKAASVPTRTVRKPRYLRLKNKLAQPLSLSVLHESGRGVVELKLGPHETSRPVAEDRLSSYTLNLIERGHVATI